MPPAFSIFSRADVVMASAALPFMFRAVEIDGVPYWDGGYMGNPAIFPFLQATDAEDVLVVQINSSPMAYWREVILDTLEAVAAPRAIYERSDSDSRAKEGLEKRAGWARGEGSEERGAGKGAGAEGAAARGGATPFIGFLPPGCNGTPY